MGGAKLVMSTSPDMTTGDNGYIIFIFKVPSGHDHS